MDDDTTVLVGAPFDKVSDVRVGSAYILTRTRAVDAAFEPARLNGDRAGSESARGDSAGGGDEKLAHGASTVRQPDESAMTGPSEARARLRAADRERVRNVLRIGA